MIGIGVIVRNHKGQVIGTFQATKNLKASAQIVESYTAMLVVTNCNELGFQKIIIEGDALQVVKDIQNKTENKVVL